MSNAFVFENDTLLCQQSSTGWLPLSVTLPVINGDNAARLNYQLGRVRLQTSLAPAHWQASESTTADLMSDYPITVENDAPATSAITYCYAQHNRVTLPEITADIDLANFVNNELTANDLASVSTAHYDQNCKKNNSQHNDKINAFIPYRQLISKLSVALADQISQAIQLLRWQADTQFCSRCSASVEVAVSGERTMVCSVCQLRQYPRVQPCVIAAITRPNPSTGETQILLAHHHRYGKQSPSLQYGLIAGFVEAGESLEHAVVREVFEEVGITLTDIRYVSSQPWPFPSNLMLGFRASYVSGDIIVQEDELSHAEFFDLSNLPKIPFKGSIAYDLIAQIAREQGVLL